MRLELYSVSTFSGEDHNVVSIFKGDNFLHEIGGFCFLDETAIGIELQQLTSAPVRNQDMVTLVDNEATYPLEFSRPLPHLAELLNKLPSGTELENKIFRRRVLLYDIGVALRICFGEIWHLKAQPAVLGLFEIDSDFLSQAKMRRLTLDLIRLQMVQNDLHAILNDLIDLGLFGTAGN